MDMLKTDNVLSYIIALKQNLGYYTGCGSLGSYLYNVMAGLEKDHTRSWKDLDMMSKRRVGLYHANTREDYDADSSYPHFNYESLVSKCLDKELYRKYFPLMSKMGVTIDKCVQNAVEHDGTLEDVTGFLAGDEESYDMFPELLNYIFEIRHGLKPSDSQPKPDLDASKLKNGQLDDEYVLSSRVRTGRSIRGFPFASMMTRADRREVESIVVSALKELDGELAGTYYPLLGMTKKEEEQLQADHFLFQKPTSQLMTFSNSTRDWPDGRGIFYNHNKTFLVWLNEEDHSRIISMQPGGNLQATFSRFCDGLQRVEQLIHKEFMIHPRLGYINACPTNIGTGIRCSVHCRLKLLGQSSRLEPICNALDLQIRGTDGEDTDTVDSVYDLSNKARVKKTEVQYVQLVVDAVHILIDIEKGLEQGKKIDDLIDQLIPEELRAKAKEEKKQ